MTKRNVIVARNFTKERLNQRRLECPIHTKDDSDHQYQLPDRDAAGRMNDHARKTVDVQNIMCPVR